MPAIATPVLASLLEPWILTLWLSVRMVKDPPSAVMVYNSTLPYVMAGAVARLFGVRVIYDVEDVPSLAAISLSQQRGIAHQIQQLSWVISAKLLTVLSGAIVVPSKRFIQELALSPQKAMTCVVVSGCVKVTEEMPRILDLPIERRPLSVLFVGIMESEHGFDLLLDAIRRLGADRGACEAIEFHLCGSFGAKFTSADIPLSNNVHFHGYVSDQKYREILGRADVGLALQKSVGFYKNTRTPSKAYEFLAAGKLLIATGVGDLEELYPERAIKLDPETGECLADLLWSIARASDRYAVIAASGLNYARDRFSFAAVGKTLESLVG